MEPKDIEIDEESEGEERTNESSNESEPFMDVNDQKFDEGLEEENELRLRSPIRRNQDTHQERHFRFPRIIRSQRSMKGIRSFQFGE